MIGTKLGYRKVDNTGAVTVKTGPAGFYGLTVVASSSATVTVYDNTSATGDVLYAKDSLTKGDTLNFGGIGIAAKKGLHVVVGGTGTVNILYA